MYIVARFGGGGEGVTRGTGICIYIFDARRDGGDVLINTPSLVIRPYETTLNWRSRATGRVTNLRRRRTFSTQIFATAAAAAAVS